MKFERLLELVGDEPCFDSSLLLAGPVEVATVRRQLARWALTGRVLQLRRGLYALAPPHAKRRPHPFAVANRLLASSYVSFQSALAHHGLIPEWVPRVLSATTRRPGQMETPLGSFSYRHVKAPLFFGYRAVELGDAQTAFVARPEKALLDLAYLESQGDTLVYLEGLRLQHLETLDLEWMRDAAERAKSPKLVRTVEVVRALERREDALEVL